MSNLEKSIYFYRISPSPSFIINAKNDKDTLYQMFKSVFPKIESTHTYSPSDQYTFYLELKELTEDFAFGTYSRKEINPNQKIQVRENISDINNEEIPKSHNFPSDNTLEYYSFFYVDFEKLFIAFINNNQSGSLDKILRGYFNQHDIHISISNYYISETKKVMDSFKRISQVNLFYNDKIAQKSTLGILGICNNDIMAVGSLNAKINFKTENKVQSRHIQRILDNQNDYSKIVIKGETNNNIMQSLDYINKSFMFHETIQMSENPLEDMNTIKNKLKSAIDKIYMAGY